MKNPARFGEDVSLQLICFREEDDKQDRPKRAYPHKAKNEPEESGVARSAFAAFVPIPFEKRSSPQQDNKECSPKKILKPKAFNSYILSDC